MGMHPNSTTKKVLNFLRKHVPHSFNAQTICRCLYGNKSKDKINAVKVALHRLWKKKRIKRISRGFYQAKIDLSLLHQIENPPTTLHGIMLECKTTKQLQKRIDGDGDIPIKQYTDEMLNLFSALDFQPITNHAYRRTLRYDKGRRITATVHLKGIVDVHIGCSENPLTFHDFLEVLAYLEGFLERLVPFSDREVVKVKQIGVGKDYKRLRLDGGKSVSLKNFKNAFAQIYYKESLGVTRFEHHLTTDMSLDEALRSLSILTDPRNIKGEEKS